MAGNHDIGLDMRDHVVDRFRRFFGALDYKFEWGQHELIVLDTISLSFGDDDSRRYAEELLGSLSKSSTELPRILFSHIPLYRPEGSGCGNSMRTSLSPIKQAYGYQYQNLISEEISVRVMRLINPVLILSGDDHDHCEYIHVVDDRSYPEVTLGTFSWMQGNRIPSFGVLTLGPNMHRLDPCLLPDQVRAYQLYLAVLFFSLLAYVVWG
eukprot:Partr_v1_DN25775_c1_g1_i1_m74514 putative Metallophosphoesterase 1